MRRLLGLIVVSMMVASCTKSTQCTTEDRSKWLDEESFKTSLTNDGYRINEFKVTEGNCYEIYGWDSEDNKVEIYFNPVDGSIVKKESH